MVPHAIHIPRKLGPIFPLDTPKSLDCWFCHVISPSITRIVFPYITTIYLKLGHQNKYANMGGMG